MFNFGKSFHKEYTNAMNQMDGINENIKKERSCKLHDFDAIIKHNRIEKYKCRNCGCIEDLRFVEGYMRGIEHVLGSEIEVSSNIFGETKYTYIGKADKGGE